MTMYIYIISKSYSCVKILHRDPTPRITLPRIEFVRSNSAEHVEYSFVYLVPKDIWHGIKVPCIGVPICKYANICDIWHDADITVRNFHGDLSANFYVIYIVCNDLLAMIKTF